MPSESTSVRSPTLFFVLACSLTWGLAAPAVWAFARRETPAPLAVGLLGLSAFGPWLAAWVLARGRFREVFTKLWASPRWVLLGLGVPLLLRTMALLIGGVWMAGERRFIYAPGTAEQLAALVVFSIGEEFGWRGFAYPLLEKKHGAVRASLVLGLGWALWHLAYSLEPGTGRFDVFGFSWMFATLPLYSLILGWLFERSGRSMAVAIAFHAAAHLQHLERAPRDPSLYLVHLVLLLAVAVFAGRQLSKRRCTAAT